MWNQSSFRHRFPGLFIYIIPSRKIKKSLFPQTGTRTGITKPAVPPCLPPPAATSQRCQHIVCLLTLALRQKILRFPVSLCPQRPICCPAFRSALSSAKLSVDALATLLPPQWFDAVSITTIKHHFRPLVKNFFLHLAETVVIFPQPC